MSIPARHDKVLFVFSAGGADEAVPVAVEIASAVRQAASLISAAGTQNGGHAVAEHTVTGNNCQLQIAFQRLGEPLQRRDAQRGAACLGQGHAG